MKPPRYLLREYSLTQLLRTIPVGNFLEVGFGSGQMLLTLSKMGYMGSGYDFSTKAHQEAKQLLAKCDHVNITLLSELDTEKQYDSILFFEVIGYFKDPVKELLDYKKILKSNGKVIFSFTNKNSAGFAEKATGAMNCFTREEIIKILERANFKVELIWNYGFPLSNILKPFLNFFHFLRVKRSERSKSGKRSKKDIRVKTHKKIDHHHNVRVEDVKKSGLAHNFLLIKIISFFLNPITIYPFAKIQTYFKNTDLGNGYLVVAKS